MIILKRLRVESFKLLRKVELAFPRQGSILVEGLNESGKSTLFESVFYALYGVPLVTEGRGKGNLDSVILYGEDAMSVDLLVEVDQTELEIRRTVKRGKSSQARLVVRRPGVTEEQVAGVLAVNARVVAELGGLDGEALLNSCFVEQKKLSKLEELVAGQRKDSLRKLLNLEKLTVLGEKFRVTPQDERALAEARQRLELAQVAAALPAVAAERASLESSLRGGESRGSGGRAAPGPDGSDPDNPDWSKAGAQLAAARLSASEARRNVFLLAITAAGALTAVAALAVAGVHFALWGLAVVLALGATSWLSYRSARELRFQAAGLEAKLSTHRDALVAKAGDLEGLLVRAERALGVDARHLDVEECQQEVARLERQLAVKRRAASIVEGTMERIVRMVLPSTERNMGHILPLLTAGRYHEARIGEDYQVQVWDCSAGRYVSKSIFSGGAKDQFSLALRLAFALATLPQELGSTPGFIFLDEPLSSFDGPRTEALVRLLTEGQIAANFSQIFVISHNRSFDAGAFGYRLVLRDGRVVESNLPSGVSG